MISRRATSGIITNPGWSQLLAPRDVISLEASMKSTGRPLALAFAGAALALVAGIAALSASLGASATVSGQFPVGAHEGMPPGSVSALVFFLGLLLVGIGAAVHDGRQLRQPSSRPAPRPAQSSSRSASRPALIASQLAPESLAHGRRTSSGAHLVLVSAARRR